MARAIWTGSLSFGLVNVPVRLFSAIEQKDIHFHQFQAGTGKRVRNLRVVEGTHEEVPYEDIVKGYELPDGRYVMLTQDELEGVEPGASRNIEIEDFVELAEIDPIYFERTYYLAPPPESGADKPYALLLQAMQNAQRVAVARFVMRGKQYLAAIRPMGDVLALETMYFPDEVRDAADLVDVSAEADVTTRELDVAARLIDSLTGAWEPDRYHDTYRERVEELIERKARGETVEAEPPSAPEHRVVDLLAALEASLDRRGDRTEKPPPTQKRSRTEKADVAKAKSARGGRSDQTRRRSTSDSSRSQPTGRSKADSTEDARERLTHLTKSELLERAREADVPGRSKMSKGELVDALEAAGQMRRAG
jgi:DNA end-binding protein Ku